MTTHDRPPDPTATLINVAHLLKASVGGAQRYHLIVPSLDLGESRWARGLEGDVKITRIDRGLLVVGEARATVELTCVRCLEEYTQPLEIPVEEEFRPSVDIATGRTLRYRGAEADGDFFLIGEDNVLDVRAALRQAAWLAAPMVPRCREDCPGIATPAEPDDIETELIDQAEIGIDARLAVLGNLLDQLADPPTRPARG